MNTENVRKAIQEIDDHSKTWYNEKSTRDEKNDDFEIIIAQVLKLEKGIQKIKEKVNENRKLQHHMVYAFELREKEEKRVIETIEEYSLKYGETIKKFKQPLRRNLVNHELSLETIERRLKELTTYVRNRLQLEMTEIKAITKRSEITTTSPPYPIETTSYERGKQHVEKKSNLHKLIRYLERKKLKTTHLLQLENGDTKPT
ncbi:hypothetical protein Tco_0859362 [Tanacetum coccineum]|uniref:Uncharacterized protein n=1 Tax=Tanacetum coccineum TaxID=301880 RepID=A0ABQ5BBW5_9ASTR